MGRVKRPLTLIELLVSFALLAIVGSAVGMQAKKLLDIHRFRTKATALGEELKQVKLLAAALENEITLVYHFSDQTLHVTIETDETLPRTIHIPSLTVDACAFDGEPLHEIKVLYSHIRQPVHCLVITSGTQEFKILI